MSKFYDDSQLFCDACSYLIYSIIQKKSVRMCREECIRKPTCFEIFKKYCLGRDEEIKEETKKVNNV